MVNTINTLTERNKELLNKIEELENLRNENKVSVEKYKEWVRKFNGRDTYITKSLFNEDWEGWKDHIYCGSGMYNEVYFSQQLPPLEFAEKLIEELLHFEDLYIDYKWKKYYPLMDEVKQLKKEAEENNSLNSKLKEELKEKEVLIEELEDENDFLEKTAECNLDAIKKCEEWERREKGKLKEEIDNKQTLLKECFDEYVKKDRELRTTNKWLEESQQNLRENKKEGLQKDEKIKRLEEQLSLANKPLPKRPSKIKLFGKEIKTKLHQFTQKFKSQKQTMIAQIEVPVKK